MRLESQEYGPPDRPTVLLLHGGGASGWTWRPVVERLSGFHLLVPDLPEHGRNLDRGPFSIPDAADRLAAVLCERAHDGRAHVVGHNWPIEQPERFAGTLMSWLQADEIPSDLLPFQRDAKRT